MCTHRKSRAGRGRGVIPSDVAGRSLGLGGECYGVVERIGVNIIHVSPGDRVICVPPAGLGSYLVVSGLWVTKSPVGVPAEKAVSGTMAYATAWFALLKQARIQKGERVLIHSAAGGVGLAAVHLCLRAGCVVFATASTEEKRKMLLSLGVARVFNSRRLEEYKQGVLAATACLGASGNGGGGSDRGWDGRGGGGRGGGDGGGA
eukprot:3566072-Pleurochrysis_carterae.AAC.1